MAEINEEHLRRIIRELMGEHHNTHVHLHIDNKVPIPIRLIEQPAPHTAFLLPIGDSSMPGVITVDTTNETVVVGFLDDKGNTTAAPAGATVSFTSDNPAVVTVAADATDPLKGDVTVVAEGTANISAALTGALEADGVTPIANPATVAITVGPGLAFSATETP